MSFYRKAKLSTKLFVLFVVLLVLMILEVSVFLCGYHLRVSEKEHMAQNVSALENLNDNLSLFVDQLSDFSLECYKDKTFMDALYGKKLDDYERIKSISDKVTAMYFSREDIRRIMFYLPEDDTIYYREKGSVTRISSAGSGFRETEWYKKLRLSNKNCYVEPCPEGDSENKLFFRYHRAITDVPYKKLLLTISIDVGYDFFEETFMKKSYENEIFAVFDKSMHLYFSNAQEQLSVLMQDDMWKDAVSLKKYADGSGSVSSDHTKYKILYSESADDIWIMVRLLPYRELRKPVYRTLISFLLASLVIFCTIIPVVVWISRTITKPLSELNDRMDHMQLENYEVIPDNDSNDEIAQLIDHFNHMILRLKQLVDREYKSELLIKDAQIKAIEAQLNPHFLYNTFQLISSKALLADVPEISDMMNLLAMNFRYMMRPESLVSICDELQFVQNYIELQKARFGSRLNIFYRYDMKDLVKHNLEVPKLCIQIPVENAIIHGMEDVSREVSVTISILYRDEMLELTVHNDGAVIPTEKMKELKEELRAVRSEFRLGKKEIGLKNLSACLYWIYGDDGYLDIASDEQQGTTVRICIMNRRKG